ncbi:hypothetical protein ACNI65_09920 [Roseateles sp. So40a]|uniref:hypothetical protein n=1 Tax=Roseateles sp. So40a TaxID=3400226 RepID=UPI003A87A2A7
MSKLSFLIGAFCCALLALETPTATAAGNLNALSKTDYRLLPTWQVQSVVNTADVQDRLQPQPLNHQVRPGDVVDVEVRYVNAAGKPATDVRLTLPVPAGGLRVLLGGSSDTPPQFASLDGKRYDPIPLKRELRLADGRRATIDVPTSEYRFVRWHLGDLPAGAERAVRARLQLPEESAAKP